MLKILSLIFLLFFLNPQKTLAAITFSISDPQYQNEEISVSVSLTGLTSVSCPNASCYLQGAFTSSTSNPRYFGFTKNHLGNWYEYIGSPEPTYIQSAFFAFPFQATWSGRLTFKSNPADLDYTGLGDYNLKLWRYTGNSSSSAGVPSNFLLVNITGPTPTPTPTPSASASVSSSSTPTPTPTPAITITSTSTPKLSSAVKTPSPTPTPIATTISIDLGTKFSTEESQILGTASALPSPVQSVQPQVKTLGQKEDTSQKVFIILGILTIITSVAIFGRQWIMQKKQ